ncbi:type IV secretion system protein [Metapseudomonas otitidis]|uniref:type IV secretion system protein n=1 Tax=Metapseudomonas otitidis TaxID=319939 RepID=UPI000D1BF846|nr:type IV secretion system protein [Pseudomonas otitidis]
MAAEFRFYTRVFTEINSALETYIQDVAANVISAITPTSHTLLAIYIALYGFMLLRGSVEEPVLDFAWRIIRIGFVMGIALNLGIYNKFVSDFIWQSPEAFAQLVTGASSNAGDNVQFLDRIFGKMYDLGEAYWVAGSAGTIPDIGLKFLALIIWLVAIAVSGYAAFLLVLSKFGLAILVAIGPVFVLLTMFDATKRFFEAWLGQAMNFVMLVMLVAASTKLLMAILDKYMGDATAGEALIDPGIRTALPAIALSVINVLVMMQLNSISSALGGGVAISTLGAASALWSKAKSATGSAKDLASGKTLSDMRAQRRQKQANARWAASNPGKTAMAGRALYSKITQPGANRVKKAS